MESFAFYSERFVLPGGVFGTGYLPVVDGKFGTFTTERPEGTIIDASGKWVAPGFVDTHIHGFFGHSSTDKDAAGLNAASIELARHALLSDCP